MALNKSGEKMRIRNLIVFLMLLLSLIRCSSKDEDSKLIGPYLGQKPPGMTPEIFAPGIISTCHDEFKIVFSPDGKELFLQIWGAPFPVITTMKEINGRWTEQVIAHFSGKVIECFDISPDGQRMFVCSPDPIYGVNDPQTIWKISISEKTETGWGELKSLDPEIQGYPTIAANGNLYLAHENDMWLSRFVNGSYSEMEKLGNSVSTERYSEQDPFIAPDESNLMFCRRDDGYGSWDIFISFRREDGSWTNAVNMGDKINSIASDVYPFVTSDGKYFFFSSRRTIHKDYSENPITLEEKIKIMNSPGNGNQDIYWVDARIIDTFKPADIK